jgi:hypothetical protein
MLADRILILVLNGVGEEMRTLNLYITTRGDRELMRLDLVWKGYLIYKTETSAL